MEIQAPRDTARIPELDGLRAVCLLFVLLAHLTDAGRLPFPPGLWQHFLRVWGNYGVQIFFGISGFIITRLLLDERVRTGRVVLRAFYVRRFFRIVPAYWTFLALTGLLAVLGEIQLAWPPWLASLFFVSNIQYFPVGGWFCGHTWSLSVEEQYYLCFPFLLWIILRGRRRPMFVALVVLYVFAAYSDRASWLLVAPGGEGLTAFKYIIAGVLLALGWERATPLMRGVHPLVVLMIVALIFARPIYSGYAPAVMGKLLRLGEALAVVYLIGWVILNPAWGGWLRLPPVQWIGRLSYSLYLWQQLFTGQASFYGHWDLGALPLSLGLLVLCGMASYHWIERPAIRFGHVLSRQIAPGSEASRKKALATAPV